MKTFPFIFSLIPFILFSCKKDGIKDISGNVTAMGQVGVTVSSSQQPIQGVSNFNASVVALQDGVSTYAASATVSNNLLLNFLSNYPDVFTINGNIVTTNSIRLKQTSEGVKCETPAFPGVVVKYSSKVGDKYPVGNTGINRQVVSKSTEDDYPYGFMLIKTIQVEQPIPAAHKVSGVTKLVYVANHRFGIVAVDVYFDDGSKVTFPLYWSAEN